MSFDYLMDRIAPDDTEVTLKRNQVYEGDIVDVKEIAKGKVSYDHDTCIFTVCDVNFTMENVYALTMYCDESIEITLRS